MKKILMIMTIAVVLSGCTKKKEVAKNIDQLHAENGFPVTVEQITPRLFETSYTYNSSLTGIQQSTEYAAIDGRIETVLGKVGDYVKKDQVLVTFPKDNPSAQYFQSKAAFENASALHTRMQELYKSGGISRQDMDNAETNFQVAKANWNTVRDMIEVKAPIDGVLSEVNVNSSDNVKKEAPLFTVSKTDKLKAKIFANEEEIKHIKKGMKALAVWQSVTVHGQVTQVALSLDDVKKGFAVELEFGNSGKVLPANISANISIVTATRENAIVVDRKFLQNGENDKVYVWTAENQTAVKRPVNAGDISGLSVEITSGLNAGDTLITKGYEALEDNAKLNIIANE